MIDWFCDIYSSIEDKNAILKRLRWYSILRALTRISANLILPIYMWATRHNKVYALANKENVENSLIVSLTSFPARINRLWIVIECMLRQTTKPDKIILWLSREQFANSKLPIKLLRQKDRGLEIRWVDGDIRSHKKYMYTMIEYPNSMVVTIDDDIFYHSHTLHHLVNSHIRHPHDVIANVAHQLRYTESGELRAYKEWNINVSTPDCSDHIFQVGIGGVLYPPQCAHTDLCKPELFQIYCPYGDDIWLFAMCRLSNTTIRTSERSFVPLPIYNMRNHSLSDSNLQGGNDGQIKHLTSFCIEQYGINPFEK